MQPLLPGGTQPFNAEQCAMALPDDEGNVFEIQILFQFVSAMSGRWDAVAISRSANALDLAWPQATPSSRPRICSAHDEWFPWGIEPPFQP
jgi:hypothetical protein